MKYYKNDIYPIALVLSYDAESINKEYFNAAPNEDKEIKDDLNVKARTMFLTRRISLTRRINDYYAMAIGIIFNGKPTFRTTLHESLHAVRMMLDVGLSIPFCDATEEAYAYLIGWIGDCIEDYLRGN